MLAGDIVYAYNNVNHKILCKILRKRIKDKKFLKLIKKTLKSGIINGETFKQSLFGAPQGGIVLPFLFNIYMLEFDKFIYKELIKPILMKIKKTKKNYSKKYQEIHNKTKQALKKLKKVKNNKETKDKQKIENDTT